MEKMKRGNEMVYKQQEVAVILAPVQPAPHRSPWDVETQQACYEHQSIVI